MISELRTKPETRSDVEKTENEDYRHKAVMENKPQESRGNADIHLIQFLNSRSDYMLG